MKDDTLDNDTLKPDRLDCVIQKLDLLLFIALSGFVFSAVYYYYRGAYLGESWPYSSPLYDPRDRFKDFDSMVRQCRDLSKAAEASLYLPVASLYFHLFGLMPRIISLAVFLTMPMLGLIWFVSINVKELNILKKLIYIVGIFLVCYPVLFALDRGNLDLHVFLFLALFAHFYQRQTFWDKGLAAFFLALAIAFKAYPILFAVLYFKDRRYRELIVSGVCTLAITLVASFPQGGLAKVITEYNVNLGKASLFSVGVAGHYNLSLFNAGRLVLAALKMPTFLKWFEAMYTLPSLAMLLLICGFASRRSLASWRSVTALACGMCFIPKISFDYRLVILLVPLCMFIRANARLNKMNTAICLIFGLLLIPKGHIILYYDASPSALGPSLATPASLINPLLLAGLAVLALFPAKGADSEGVAASIPEEQLNREAVPTLALR